MITMITKVISFTIFSFVTCSAASRTEDVPASIMWMEDMVQKEFIARGQVKGNLGDACTKNDDCIDGLECPEGLDIYKRTCEIIQQGWDRFAVCPIDLQFWTKELATKSKYHRSNEYEKVIEEAYEYEKARSNPFSFSEQINATRSEEHTS